VSPVNCVYSIRNIIDDWKAPKRHVDRFSLRSSVSLCENTIYDLVWMLMGRGAILRALARRPLLTTVDTSSAEPTVAA
jgi:hypothetical protein